MSSDPTSSGLAPDASNPQPGSSGQRATTPNLIARSDSLANQTVTNDKVASTPASGIDATQAWSTSADVPFTTQLDGLHPVPRDRLRSYPSYGPPAYHSGPQPGQWQPMDPRYAQRIDPALATNRPQQPPLYGYPQPGYLYEDPRLAYQTDPRYFMEGPQNQPYQTAHRHFDQSQQPRYRQATYPIGTGSPVAYESQQRSYVMPPSPSRLYMAEPPQMYPRQRSQPLPALHPTIPQQRVLTGTRSAPETRPTPPEPTPSYPRGPPRKPKQSGFAVWVGNLSPGTTIIQLKDYFSRGATTDIESIFLISKSNCAFVNYRTAESAQAAVARFHDSRLNGVRLVCRLRHGQTPSTMPTAATTQLSTPSSALVDDSARSREPAQDGVSPTDIEGGVASLQISGAARSDDAVSEIQITTESVGPGKERVLEKYFIVKSLTLQDLEASVRDGIWATQSHNESALNEAFESAQNVYLIFSANKSGEYFGYARMRSAINPGAVTSNPRVEIAVPAPSDGPTSTPTPATEFAPKGRIVDDSARGTIFWEADTSSESESVDGERDESPEKSSSRSPRRKSAEELAKQDWGKPFQIEWLNTTKLPFYKTRGLRNPWNANREVKIARDGTELEPSVGKRLIEMFHQGIPSPSTTSGFSYQTTPQGPVVAVGSSYSAPSQPRPSGQ